MSIIRQFEADEVTKMLVSKKLSDIITKDNVIGPEMKEIECLTEPDLRLIAKSLKSEKIGCI